MERSAATSTPQPGWVARTSSLASVDRIAWAALGVAAALSAALILWESRENTFFNDEILVFQELGRGFDADAILAPHNGHLVAVANLLYELVFSAIGPDYAIFRVLGVLGVVLCALLVFVYLRRRVDPLLALAPAVVLLFLGASWEVLLWPFSVLTSVFALAAGIAALLLLERETRGGDVGACLLLILALASYSIGIAFLVGAAVSVLLRPDRWRRAWVFAVPLALYAAWWLWALKFDSETQLSAVNAWLIPSYAAGSLAVVLAVVSGLGASLSGEGLNPTVDIEPGWGRILAIAAVVALVVRLTRGRVPRSVWVSLAVLLAYWGSAALGLGPDRTPEQSRYVFPGAVLVFLVAGDALAGLRVPRAATLAILAVAAIAVLTGVRQVHDGALFLRDYSQRVRADLAMLELGREEVPADFAPAGRPELEGAVPPQLPLTAGPFLEAVDRFGSFADSPAEVLEQAPEIRDGADRVLASAVGIELAGAPAKRTASARCRTVAGPEPGAPAVSELAPGTVVLRARAPAAAALGRFSDTFPVDLGEVAPGEPAALRIPADAYDRSWRVSLTSESPVALCPA